MDQIRGAHLMTKINIGTEGKFLSGRSRAAELVDHIMESNPNLPLTLDFTGVESASQSFISELLFVLKERGVQIHEIQFTGIKDKEIDARIKREIERLSQLIAV